MKENIFSTKSNPKLFDKNGSKNVMNGQLKGCTDTDHFYFLCPTCKEILAVTDFYIHQYNKKDIEEYFKKNKEYYPQLKQPIRIILKLYCKNCKKTDYTKISNIGWLSGKLENKEKEMN